MADIKLLDGTIKPDQRTNGARLKLAVGDWIKIFCVLIGIVWGYAVLTTTVNANSTMLLRQIADTTENKIRSISNEQIITLLKEDIVVIKQDVKELLKLAR